MPSRLPEHAGTIAYALTLAAAATAAWFGPTYSPFAGAPDWLRLPSLETVPSAPGAAWFWGPAMAVAVAMHVRFALAGAPRGSQALPYAFLAVAGAFACAAWAVGPGDAAALLSAFARTTGLLFLGFLALGLACMPDDEQPATAPAEVVRLPQAAPRAEAVPVALAA